MKTCKIKKLKTQENIARISCPICGTKGIQPYEKPLKLEDCFKRKWHDCTISPRTPEQTEQAIFKNKAKLVRRKMKLQADDCENMADLMERDMRDIAKMNRECNEKLFDEPKKSFFQKLKELIFQLRP